MRRVVTTARGVTISFLMDELREFGDALGALIDSKDHSTGFSDDHMESLSSLFTKIRTAVLVATEGETLRRETREHLTYECDADAE